MRVPPEILGLIKGNKKFLIVSHINPEGDSAGSSIALALGLKKIGKYTCIFSREPLLEILRFLPSSDMFSQKVPSNGFDVLFLLDCNTVKRTGLKTNCLLPVTKKIVVIDHHLPYEIEVKSSELGVGSPKYNSKLKAHNSKLITHKWIDPDASATGVLIYKLLNALRIPVDKEIATNLYTAILTDTGSFRYSNTNPESLNIASQLLKAGAEPWGIAKEVYDSFSFNRLRLLTLCLNTLKRQGKLAWVTITRDMYKKTKTSVQDTETFADYTRKIKGVEVGILFRQVQNESPKRKGLYKISLRSKGRVNVAEIAGLFGGGGHHNAAGCELKGSLEEVKKKVFGVIKKAIKKLELRV